MYMLRLYLPVCSCSQVAPVYEAEHSQRKPSPALVHVPPLAHGWLAHTSAGDWSQLWPVQPDSQVHECVAPAAACNDKQRLSEPSSGEGFSTRHAPRTQTYCACTSAYYVNILVCSPISKSEALEGATGYSHRV